MRHDIVSDMFYVIDNAEKAGRKYCTVPASSVAKDILMVMERCGYIGKIEPAEGRKFSVELLGKINRSRAIKPRFAVGRREYEKFEKRFLPSRDFGILIVSTSKGVLDQKQAAKLGLGGRLLGYVY